jgi:uncharacterized protein
MYTSSKITLCSMAAALVLLGCGSDSDSQSNNVNNVPSSGASLPYEVLRNDLINGARASETFEIRNGGFGSAATAHPTNANRFYALTDRGPNATYADGKIFPVPDYTPRIGLFEVQSNGSVAKISEILLKDRDGNPISGLPNSSALGGTGETPYDAHGALITNANGDVKLDDYGLDSEGLAALKDGSFWVSDEYGPHMVHYDANGKEISRINPFANDTRNTYTLPAEFGNRWANRGMEGLCITPDQKTLVGIMQSTLDNPSKAVRGTLTRIVSVDLESGAIKQYLYKQEKAKNSNSEIAALGNDSFLIIERDGSFYTGGGNKAATPSAQKHIYKVKLSSGTELENLTLGANMVQDAALGLSIEGKTLEEIAIEDGGWETLAAKGITPVSKSLVVDMVAAIGYPHDKMEGLIVFDNSTLGVLNDDDFATWVNNDVLEQKYLGTDQNIIDANTLYVIKGLDLSAN